MIRYNLFSPILLIIMLFFPLCCPVCASEAVLRISEEVTVSEKPIKVSSLPMMIDEKAVRILIPENQSPQILFFDQDRRQLFWAMIKNGVLNKSEDVKAFDMVPPLMHHPMNYPNIFLRDNVINVIYTSSINAQYESPYDLCFLKLSNDGSKMYLDKRNRVSRSTFGSAGIHVFPYGKSGDDFLVVGSSWEKGWRPLDILTALATYGHGPIFSRNLVWTIKGDQVSKPQTIETQKRVYVNPARYAVSPIGDAHSLWVRNDCPASSLSLDNNYQQSVRYSGNLQRAGWSEPLVLFRTTSNSSQQSTDRIAITCNDRGAHVLWADVSEGLFYAEIREGKMIEKVNLSKAALNIVNLEIGVDRQGNVMALVGRVADHSYELTAFWKHDGQWTKPVSVLKGSHWLAKESIDMIMDNKGIVHLVYGRYAENGSVNIFYRTIIPNLKNEGNPVKSQEGPLMRSKVQE